jgi:hypothetical protein
MTKAELAVLIDSYADAKTSGNKYLIKKMIEELEAALSEVFGTEEGEAVSPEVVPEGEY